MARLSSYTTVTKAGKAASQDQSLNFLRALHLIWRFFFRRNAFRCLQSTYRSVIMKQLKFSGKILSPDSNRWPNEAKLRLTIVASRLSTLRPPLSPKKKPGGQIWMTYAKRGSSTLSWVCCYITVTLFGQQCNTVVSPLWQRCVKLGTQNDKQMNCPHYFVFTHKPMWLRQCHNSSSTIKHKKRLYGEALKFVFSTCGGLIVRGTTTILFPYWANGLFYPNWNRLYQFTTYR